MIVWIVFGIIVVLYFAIGLLYKKYWNKDLDVEVFLPSYNVHEGETATVKEVIINDKFMPLPTLETHFTLGKGLRYVDMSNSMQSDNLYRRDVFAVGIKRKISRSFDIECSKRGYYNLDKVSLVSSDLFMIQKFLGEIPLASSFYVYPRRVKSDKLAVPYRQIMGEMLARQKVYEDPFSFAGIRDYVIGDPMNTINWKATAKSQDLVVNVCDSAISQKMYVLLDTYENDLMYSEELNEESIRIASALMERLLYQGVQASLFANSTDGITGETLSIKNLKGIGVHVVKEALARIKLGKEKRITEFFDTIPSDSFVVIISKNTDIHEAIVERFTDYMCIVPYKNIEPDIKKLKKSGILWATGGSNIGIDK